MPKMKTHKGFKSRMRLTKNNKVMRTQCGVRHLLADRSPRRMRKLHKVRSTVHAGTVRRVRVAFAGKSG